MENAAVSIGVFERLALEKIKSIVLEDGGGGGGKDKGVISFFGASRESQKKRMSMPDGYRISAHFLVDW